MFPLFRVYICVLFSFKVLTLRAPTWDHCHCTWDAWRSWSVCTEICGGGIQNRSRSVWHDDNEECDSFDKCASVDDALETRTCNMICYNGGLLKQNDSRLKGSCDCPKGTTGACCKAVTCGPPSAILYGSYTGNDYTYNHHVLYKCDKDYNMTNTSAASRTCTEHGYWSGNSPVCMYARSCDSNPCKNGAHCLNLLGDYYCSCPPKRTGKQCGIENNGTVDVVNIAVGVSVSIALLVLTVLTVLVVRAHLSKRKNEHKDTEIQTVSRFVNLSGKHGGAESSPF